MIEVRQACRPRTADRRQGFIGRLIKDSAATWRKKRALHWPVSLWTPAYSYLRHAPFLRNKTFFFTQQIFFSFSFTPDANRGKAEMSPLSLRYRGCSSHAFLSQFSQHLLESPETFTRLHFISPFVNEYLNWNFFTLSLCHIRSVMAAQLFYKCFSRSIP